jgi:hypothetical protein
MIEVKGKGACSMKLSLKIRRWRPVTCIRKCGCISRKSQKVNDGDILQETRQKEYVKLQRRYSCDSTVHLLYCVLNIYDGASSSYSDLYCYVIIRRWMTVFSVYDGTKIAILEITLETQCMMYPERCFRHRIQISGTLQPEKVCKLSSLSLWSVKFIYVSYKYSFLTSQETHSISVTISSLLMLLREIITVLWK